MKRNQQLVGGKKNTELGITLGTVKLAPTEMNDIVVKSNLKEMKQNLEEKKGMNCEKEIPSVSLKALW